MVQQLETNRVVQKLAELRLIGNLIYKSIDGMDQCKKTEHSAYGTEN